MPYGNHVRTQKTSMFQPPSSSDDLVKRFRTDFVFENAEGFVEGLDQNIGQLVRVVVLKKQRERLFGRLVAIGFVRHIIVLNLSRNHSG